MFHLLTRHSSCWRFCAALFVCLCFFPYTAQAAYPGFRTLGLWIETEQVRLDLCIWYPVSRPAGVVRYDEWLLNVNRRAKPMEGKFPLVILSHDSSGNRFTHHQLAGALASLGFIVIAPTHRNDNIQNMENLFTNRQLTVRLEEIQQTIEKICADPELSPHIDMNRISLIGFGAGGSVALITAGGRVSPLAWSTWQATAPKNHPYQHAWVQQRLNALPETSTLLYAQADPRIRSIVSIAPAHSMLFDAKSLARIRIPVLLVTAERDAINPAPAYLEPLRAALPATPTTAFIAGAVPLDFMARPDGEMMNLLPGYSLPGPRQHAAITNQLYREVSQFLLATIGDPNLPAPPPPLEDDTLAPVQAPSTPAPAKPVTPKKSKKR